MVDGNNVMGSRPDGWWRDRAGAARRLVERIVAWQHGRDEPVLVVFDGRERPAVRAVAVPGVEVRFAPGGRDAADDAIVALLADPAEEAGAALAAGTEVVVVSADRGLLARLPEPVGVEGPRRFLARLDAAAPPSA